MNQAAQVPSLQQVETISGAGSSASGSHLLPVTSVVTPLHSKTGGERPAEQSVALDTKARVSSIGNTSDFEQFAKDLDPAKLLIIPVGVSIKGVLTTGGDHAVVVAGHFEGDIDAGQHPVIIKKGASVLGCVRSEDCVVVAGSLTSKEKEGEAIVTSGLWVIADTGNVKGDVAYGRQRAYEGGVFSGRARPFSEYADKS